MQAALALALLAALGASSCSTMKKLFATDTVEEGPSRPIANPFGDQAALANDPARGGGNMILRTKKGDRSIEVELPRVDQGMTDFVIPVNPAFKDDASRNPASEGLVDDSYRERKMSYTDHEIVSRLPQGSPENATERREVEEGLGLMPSEDQVPSDAADSSYLAHIDKIKQLYHLGRYEAALLEIDEMVRVYPTDPKLYAMRGTLLDRLGKVDLAIKSWNQALRFDPSNLALKKFVERRQQKRSLAGQ